MMTLCQHALICVTNDQAEYDIGIVNDRIKTSASEAFGKPFDCIGS